MKKKSKQGSKSPLSAKNAKAEALDLHAVEQVLEFMTQHGLEEFEYSNGNIHVRLKKPGAASTLLPRPLPLPDIVVAGPAPAVAAVGPVPAAERAPEAPAEVEAGALADLHLIKSPIVGTFYSAPNPGAEPFVKVGDRVDAGQVLCIIEAMKLMNEIESDAAGEVVRVYAENGQPVEYGELLFALRPTRKR
jgi:acetyl-CoA carboxylase biotin carboxyl carrier protein